MSLVPVRTGPKLADLETTAQARHGGCSLKGRLTRLLVATCVWQSAAAGNNTISSLAFCIAAVVMNNDAGTNFVEQPPECIQARKC